MNMPFEYTNVAVKVVGDTHWLIWHCKYEDSPPPRSLQYRAERK